MSPSASGAGLGSSSSSSTRWQDKHSIGSSSTSTINGSGRKQGSGMSRMGTMISSGLGREPAHAFFVGGFGAVELEVGEHPIGVITFTPAFTGGQEDATGGLEDGKG